MKRVRTYKKRLNIDMGGFKNQYEESENVNENFGKVLASGTVSENDILLLLRVRA